jgi:hypothetical protein
MSLAVQVLLLWVAVAVMAILWIWAVVHCRRHPTFVEILGRKMAVPMGWGWIVRLFRRIPQDRPWRPPMVGRTPPPQELWQKKNGPDAPLDPKE